MAVCVSLQPIAFGSTPYERYNHEEEGEIVDGEHQLGKSLNDTALSPASRRHRFYSWEGPGAARHPCELSSSRRRCTQTHP